MAVFEITLVLGLIVLNGFFAMSELAIVSARRTSLEQRADDGSRGARIALELAEDPTRFLSTVQIGITLIGILAGAFSGATLAGTLADLLVGRGVSPRLAQPLAIGVVVLVLTYLSLIIGELVPKRFALAHAEAIACRVAPAIRAVARLAHPAVSLLQISTDALTRLLGVTALTRTPVTDEEILALVTEGTRQGVITPAEREMVDEVLRLADRPVRTIMTARADLAWFDLDASSDELRRIIAEHGYSRFPVCEGDLEHCIGYVRTQDVIDRLAAGETVDLRAALRKPLVVNQELNTLELMMMFRHARPHLALVADEHGTILGMVTPTDVLETIVGEFPDEADAQPQVFRRDDGSWLVDAQMELEDLEEALDANGLATGSEFTTVAGLILGRLGRVPRVGEALEINGWRLEVADLDGHRIDQVLVERVVGGGEG